MNNLMNSDSGRVYPVVTPFLGKGASDIFINLPAFQEVLETLDVFSEVIIKGRVIDRMGLPVAGALVEMIWNTDLPLHQSTQTPRDGYVV